MLHGIWYKLEDWIQRYLIQTYHRLSQKYFKSYRIALRVALWLGFEQLSSYLFISRCLFRAAISKCYMEFVTKLEDWIERYLIQTYHRLSQEYFKSYRIALRVALWLDIQIKICAEYRDMLPRPRLVCQEPGLRPIGRSPGVPDKSSRGLGSMSWYSSQILICFIAYIFSIFNFSVGLVGNLAELPPCTVPPATVHCYQNEAAQCSSDNQISQHALLRGSRKKHSLAFMPQNWWN